MVEVGFHEGTAVNRYSFSLIMDQLIKEVQNEAPWCLMFADNVVLVNENINVLEGKLEHYQKIRNRYWKKIN